MKKIKDYNKNMAEVGKFYYYGSMSPVGKKVNAFWELMDDPEYKQLKSEVKYIRGFLDAFGGMMKEQLEKNGVRGTKSATGNIYQMLDGMEVILKNEEVHAMQFGALGKYVTAYIDASEIYHGSLPEGFAPDGTWYKNDQGVYVRDMKLVEEMEEN